MHCMFAFLTSHLVAKRSVCDFRSSMAKMFMIHTGSLVGRRMNSRPIQVVNKLLSTLLMLF